MKLEIEAKIRVDSLDLITEQLKAVQAHLQQHVHESDTYFDSKDGTLLNSQCGLRLRKRIRQQPGHPQQQTFYLTFKGPKQVSAFKSRPEAQVVVDDYDTMKHILLQLGYREALFVEKERTIWLLDDCEICLDDVAGLGLFVEVEGPDETVVHSVLVKLGLHDCKHISHGYASMMAKKMNLDK